MRKHDFLKEVPYARTLARLKDEAMFIYWDGKGYETRGGGNPGHVAKVYPGGRVVISESSSNEARWAAQ